MAKRTRKATPKVEEAQEMPAAEPVTSGDTEPAPTLPPDTEMQWIISENTGELRQVTSRAGYAPTPMPAAFRLAKADEVPGEE